ncbi:chromatin accessibility complex 16kD protein [Episyrphus balteatus]|uniref:chromatin accessibility complex 16kD protein n=1 Tax=Episyrphus balteatus TaxID=286459 RepID=UPI0024855E68|nr:chromatin accessibility complex 16kD protein [Episyrphus balteatus]
MVEPKVAAKNKKEERSFPLSRVRTIMKSSVDTGNISNDVLFVVEKSAEMFIQKLAKNAYKNCKQGHTLQYEHLSSYVTKDDSLEFLLQIVPEKITVKEFKEIIAEEKESDESSSESDDEPQQPAAKKKTPSKKQ